MFVIHKQHDGEGENIRVTCGEVLHDDGQNIFITEYSVIGLVVCNTRTPTGRMRVHPKTECLFFEKENEFLDTAFYSLVKKVFPEECPFPGDDLLPTPATPAENKKDPETE